MDVPDKLRQALADRYTLERELGQGGMATVYLAHDPRHERSVAIKVLRPELAAMLGPDRFLREVRIAANLQHPNILAVYDSGEAGGFLYYVMPYVEGPTLRDSLSQHGEMPVAEAARILRDVADALAAAHAKGVVHRDIKPENILLSGRHALVADFGVAKAVSEATGRQTLTTAGVALGTPTYMAPEQAAADPHTDHRADLYAFGVMAYEMLTGQPPFVGPTAQAVLAAHMTEPPVAVTQRRATIPPQLAQLIMRCLAKKPADRPQTAEELLPVLEMLATPSGGITPMDTQPVRAVSLAGALRRPAAKWLVAAGILVVAGAAWAVLGRGGRGPAPSPFAGAVPVQLTTSGRVSSAVPSPDGSLVAYAEQHCEEGGVCRGDLVIRETAGEGISTIVSEPGHASFPMAWSPDGRWVAFSERDVMTGKSSGLYVVPQRGGTLRRVAAGLLIFGGFVAPDTLVLTPVESERHWLRRVVASTGAVVDSVPLPVGRYAFAVVPGPTAAGGARVLVLHQDLLITDSMMLSVFDRRGRATDSLRVPAQSSVAWAGATDAVVLALPARGVSASEGAVGLVFVRRRLDGRGRFLPNADTLKASGEGLGTLSGVSADGTQLFYEVTRAGETSYWTATRLDARGALTRGRRVGSSTARLWAQVSRGGRWILTTSPAGAGLRLEVEPFDGGERHVLEPALAGFRNWAWSFRDDSLIVATDAGAGRTALTVYPLPSGAPVPRGTFDFLIDDLEGLSDGRLATLTDAGRVVRVIGRRNEVKDFPVPDSLGTLLAAAPSPVGPEFAVATFAVQGGTGTVSILRLDPDVGRYTLVARSSAFVGVYGVLSWTTDGWLHLLASGPGDQSRRLYRVRAGGGAFEAEPPIGFESNAHAGGLSRDGRRTVVTVRSQSTDIWVLRAGGK